MTVSKSYIGSDLARVDAYQLGDGDYEEIPEATAADFARATVSKGGVPVRGRPAIGERAKKQVTLRLDGAVLTHFRASGAGWQARMNGWLAARQEIAGVIAIYENTINEMRLLLTQLKDTETGSRTLKRDQIERIETVEKQIALSEKAAANVRTIVRDQEAPAPASTA